MATLAPIIIDGSYLEGGGQILRMGLALSAVQALPISVTKVRAGRSTPGLRPQHLTGLQLVRDASKGRLEGGQIGSCEITFYPGTIAGGGYLADTQTAGSVTLLIQAVLPCTLFANSPSYYKLRGGTNAEFAPQIDYTIQVFRKIIYSFGVDFTVFLNKRGFFPKGQGEVTLEVKPVMKALKAADITDFGEVVSVHGIAYVAGVLPIKVAHKMANAAVDLLHQRLPQNIDIRINRVKDDQERAFGNGSGIVLWAKTSTGCILGGSALGKRGREAEEDGCTAASEIISCVENRLCLDSYAQDQVIIYMALAEGKSRIRTGPLTNHTRTAIWVAEMMTKAEFKIIQEEGTDCIIVECEGIGFTRARRN
ncbi:hypothetical protein O3P69_004357 [Scylla paramamosain]|uniref:RNA 3'-terminal phosphate cyclase n=1 Tax=Scylla paramamosain TaxID=85552 RepID=A0AAW0UD73_SCYPA